MSAPPTPGTKAALAETLRTTKAKLRELKVQMTVLDAEKRLAERERDALTSDLQLVAQLLLREARRRQWCGDYERFVLAVNKRTRQPRLLERPRPGITPATANDCRCSICEADRIRAARAMMQYDREVRA